MTEEKYREVLRQIRTWIAHGTAEDLKNAEEALIELRSVYPKRLPYFAAEVALMLAKDAPAEDCRALVDYAVQEFHPQEGLADLFALKAQTYAEETPERRQLEFLSAFYGTGALPQREFAVLDEMKDHLRAGMMDADGLYDLAVQYYVTRNPVLSLVLMMAWCMQTGHFKEFEQYVLQDAGRLFPHPFHSGNDGLLARLFTDGVSHTFLVIMATDDDDMPVLSMGLRLLGQQVICVRESGEVCAVQDAETYAQECVQAAEAVGEEICVTVGKCRTESGAVVDAVPAVVRLLARSIVQDAPLIVFSSERRMAEIHDKTALAGDIQRLSGRLPSAFSYAGAFAWTGSYLRYVSYLYGASVEELLAAPSSCEFSIVIPVRNAADTLRHTLKTCLAIAYEGSYEIVLSDNSDEGCTAVRELYEELGDSRIRYYKTPFPLSLDKTFEFAYLHARGDFIFSIGADDGVYPWALNHLKQALTDHPDESIFSWTRGFYTWPDFSLYPCKIVAVPLYDLRQNEQYIRYGLASHQQDVIRRIEGIFYSLPTLYINSGFRSSYRSEMLRRTGRFLDGFSQDGYMAAVNLCLNDHGIEVRCPITIAGMSGHSIGGKSLVSDTDLVREAKSRVRRLPIRARLGEYVMRDSEWKIPYVDAADKIVFYTSVLRLTDLHLMDAVLDEEAVLAYVEACIPRTDPAFERCYGLLIHAASLCSEELYQKYLKRYAQICAAPIGQEGDVLKTVVVQPRYDAERKALTLDADAFDCHNIADAVALTARILNL
jgi:hypothetical protein PPSC2_c4905